jgi:hypothetical protein
MARKRKKKAKPKTAKLETGYRKPAGHVCSPCTCKWEGTLVTLVGLLGLIDYFGHIDLSPIKWDLLWPIVMLVVGMLMLSGLLRK